MDSKPKSSLPQSQGDEPQPGPSRPSDTCSTGQDQGQRVDSWGQDVEGYSDDEYEDASSSSDEEVVVINPGKEDYIEIPRSKGEPPPKTKLVNRIPRNLLGPFWTLYSKQPEHIKAMIRLHFYKGKPVVQPHPLQVFLQKLKAYKANLKLESQKKKKQEEMDNPPHPSIPIQQRKSSTSKLEKKLMEGKVSLLDVCETATQLIHVDYPGRVINPGRAVETMGGLDNITKVFSNVNKKLPIRFRPEDPYCNAATAEAHPTVGLYIRVYRRKPLPKPKVAKPKTKLDPDLQVIDLEAPETILGGSEEPPGSAPRRKTVLINGVPWTKEQMLKEDRQLLKGATEKSEDMLRQWSVEEEADDKFYINVPKGYQPKVETKLHLDVLGIVHRTYKFDGICDFQFLPMKTTKDGNVSTRNRVIPFIGKPNGEDAFVGADLLSGKTEVERFLLPGFMSRIDRPQDQFLDADKVSKVPHLKKLDKDVITTNRVKRTVYTLVYSFQIDKSKNPIPTEPLEEALEDVSKRRLHGSSMTLVRRCFERRPVWTKIALEYETQLPSLTLKYVLPCVSYFATNGPWRSLWVRFGFDPRDDPSTFLYQTVDFRVPYCYKQYIEEGERANGDDSYFVFRSTILPPKAQMFYQICELKCDEIERLIDIATEKMGKYELEYDSRWGWLKEGTFEYIRHVLVQYVEIQLEEMGKISEHPTKKLFLSHGELELTEKMQPRPRDVRRLRRAKPPKRKSTMTEHCMPSFSSATSTTAASKETKTSKPHHGPSSSRRAYQGILQDLSIKDIGGFESREEMEIMDEDENIDSITSEEEEDDYEEEIVSDEDSDADENTVVLAEEPVKVQMKTE